MNVETTLCVSWILSALFIFYVFSNGVELGEIPFFWENFAMNKERQDSLHCVLLFPGGRGTRSENDHTFGPKFAFQNRTLAVKFYEKSYPLELVHFFKVSRP